jgi:hypothetical protein
MQEPQILRIKHEARLAGGLYAFGKRIFASNLAALSPVASNAFHLQNSRPAEFCRHPCSFLASAVPRRQLFPLTTWGA